MNKKELYQSIEKISQDRHLKERIIKAVEEKDEISAIKRPVFVPVLIALLVFINVSMVLKLVIFDKSQVNLTEFKPRSSMNEPYSTDEASANNFNATDELGNKNFDEIKSDFLKEISTNTYSVVEEHTIGSNFDPKTEEPFYISSNYSENYDNTESSGYFYQRYVQIINDIGEYKYSGKNGEMEANSKAFGTAYTNHEYIVIYDGSNGNGCDPDNIVSITESNVNNKTSDKSVLEEAAWMKNNDPMISEMLSELGNEIIDRYSKEDLTDSTFYINSIYYMFPFEGAGKYEYSKNNVIYQCVASVSLLSNENEWISENYFLNTEAEDITKNLYYIPYGYWKDTVSAVSEEKSELVEVPDIVGIQFSDAKKVIEDAGLKIGGITYIPPNDIAYNINEIVESSLNPGDIVNRNTEIYIKVFGKMMPELQGCSIEEALELLDGYDIKINTEYEDGSDETGYVNRFTPSAGTSILEVESVTLYISGNN